MNNLRKNRWWLNRNKCGKVLIKEKKDNHIFNLAAKISGVLRRKNRLKATPVKN